MRNQQHRRKAATFGFEGLYQFEKFRVDADGNELPGTRTVISPWQGNLITDAGLNYLGSTSQDNLTMCRIGTGNTAPANSDTALGAQVGTSTTAGTGSASGYDTTSRFLWRRVALRFAAGTISGMNLAEVGMAASSAASLFSRSLIKDTGGSPTTITLASDEVLDVLYELRMYLPAQDATVAATIDGSANTVTIRVTEHDTSLGAWAKLIGGRMTPDLSVPGNSRYGCGLENVPAAVDIQGNTGSSANIGSTSVAAYSAGTFTTTVTTVLGLTNANFGTGVGALLVSGANGGGTDLRWQSPYGYWAYGFATKLNKTSARTATIVYGITWGRYTP